MKKFLFHHLGQLIFLALFLCQISFAEDIQVISKSIVNCEGSKQFAVGAVTAEQLALTTKDLDAALALYKRKPCLPYRTFITMGASITEPVIKSSSSKSSPKPSSVSSSSKKSSSSSSSTASVGPAGPIPILSATGSTELAGNTPVGAIDNNAKTRWESKWQTDPSWITLDLGAAKPLGSIEIDWEDSNAKVYVVQGSNDADTWSDIVSKTDGENFQRTDSLKLNGTYRYVRVFCQQRTDVSEWGYSIYEIRLISAGPVTQSSVSSKSESSQSSSFKSAAPGVPASVTFTQPSTRENGDAYPPAERGGYMIILADLSVNVKALDIKAAVTEEMTVSIPFLVSADDTLKIAAYDKTGVYSKFVIVER